MTKSGLTASYSYDANGLRTSKTVNGVTTEFYWLEGRLLGQKTGNNTIFYLYDENGEMIGFTYGGQSYYYVKNLQGDVIAPIKTMTSPYMFNIRRMVLQETESRLEITFHITDSQLSDSYFFLLRSSLPTHTNISNLF